MNNPLSSDVFERYGIEIRPTGNPDITLTSPNEATLSNLKFNVIVSNLIVGTDLNMGNAYGVALEWLVKAIAQQEITKVLTELFGREGSDKLVSFVRKISQDVLVEALKDFMREG